MAKEGFAMSQVSLYSVLYSTVAEFFKIPKKCHCTHHTGYYSHYSQNDLKDVKPIIYHL